MPALLTDLHYRQTGKPVCNVAELAAATGTEHPQLRQEPASLTPALHISLADRPDEDGRARLQTEIQPYLAQAKQVEVVDRERRNQQLCPAKGPTGPDQSAYQRIIDRPDDYVNRLPKTNQQGAGDTRH